ncbi:hypothetical protein, partial [Streptococcus pneumoniae]|uniref:hypothetical protein n=1 Tax=Streptococcus pneumoniae TaxID=1313 RepID=UPI0019D6B3EF
MTAGLAVVLVLLCAVGALMGFRDDALISALAGSHLAVRLSLHIDVAHTIFDLVRAEVLLSLLLSPLIAWALARLLTA